MKKAIEDHSVFRRGSRDRHEVNDEIKTSISYIKDELQNSIKNNIISKTRKEK